MKEKRSGKVSAEEATTDWKSLRTLSDKSIRNSIKTDPEVHPTDADFWKSGKVVLRTNGSPKYL